MKVIFFTRALKMLRSMVWMAAAAFVCPHLAQAMSADDGVYMYQSDGVMHVGNSHARLDNDVQVQTGRVTADVSTVVMAETGQLRRQLTLIDRVFPILNQRERDQVMASIGAGSQGVILNARDAVPWPSGYDAVRPYLVAAAQRHAVDPALVIAVAAAESSFRVDAVSPKGALGLMQLMPATARQYGLAASNTAEGRRVAMEPQANANAGTRYLAYLLQLFDGDRALALAAYNAGEGAVAKYGNRIPPYPETQNYVKKVLRFYENMAGL